MNKRFAKFVSMVLVLIMALGVLPMSAIAGDRDGGKDGWDWWIKPDPKPNCPEMTLSSADGGVDVTVDAPEGALPKGTKMDVEKVADIASIQKAVDKAEGISGTVLTAVDITFLKKGAEVQPNGEVTVTMSSDDISGHYGLKVIHIKDNGTKSAPTIEEVEGVVGSGKKVTFKADSFSVYAVIGGESNTVKLLTVKFYDKDKTNLINIQQIRMDQIDDLDAPVFDPGVPSINPTQAFEGWEKMDDAEKTNLSVAEINSYIKENYGDTTADDDTLEYYALVYDVAFITFHDQDGTVIRLESIHLTNGEGSYTLNLSYSPFSGDWAFIGWTPVINNTGKEPTYPENPTVYKNGDPITVRSSMDLYPYLKQGHWMIFDNYIDQDDDKTSASFTSPIYFETNEDTKEPTDYGDANNDGTLHDAAPYRPGYNFDGWYTVTKDSQGKITGFGPKYVWGQKLTEDTTVYAKWSPRTDTPYMVVIWTQRAEDPVDSNNKNNTYDFYKAIDIRKGTTGDLAHFLTEDTQLGGSEGTELGYYFTYNAEASDTDGVIIKGDGTTVVNVYYNRRTLTIRFYQSGTKDYSTTHSSESELIDGYTYYIYQDSGYTSLVYHADTHTFTTSSGTSYSFSQINSQYYIRELKITYGSEITSYKRVGLFEHELPDWPAPGSGNAWFFHDPSDGTHSMQTTATSPDHYIIKVKNSEEWKLYLGSYSEPSSYDTIHYYTQGLDGTYTQYRSHRLATSGSTLYYDGFEFFGFKGIGYNNRTQSMTDSNYQTWNAVKGDYRSVSHSNIYNGHSYIYYERNKWKLEFISNGSSITNDKLYAAGSEKDIGNVPFEQPLAEYEPTVEPTNGPAGCYFDGWYKDPGCTDEFEWDIDMPNSSVVVYAKWTKMRFRVVLDYTGGDSNAQVVFPGNQASTFRVDYGEQVRDTSIQAATREGYTLLGWYLDKDGNHTFNFGEAITDKTFGMDFSYTPGTGRTITDPVTGNTFDDDELLSDGSYKYYNLIGKVTIYALWRQNPIGSDGIRVRYDAIDKKGYFPPESDPLVIIRDDPNVYTDKAKAFAQPGSTPIDQDQQFLYWVIMKPDAEGNLQPTEIKVYPGQTFTVGYEYTVRTDAYKITWVYWNSDHSNEITQTTTVTEGAEPQHSKPSGYTQGGYYYPVIGWTDGNNTYNYDGEDNIELPAAEANTTYNAVYGPRQEVSTVSFTVTWNNWNGTQLAQNTVEAGSRPSYTGATPTRDPDANLVYTFSGWTDGSNTYAAGDPLPVVSGNITYTATYSSTQRTYDVVFHSTRGTFSDNSTTYTRSGVTMDTLYRDIFPSDDPTHGTYKFYGWYTAQTGGEKVEETAVFNATVIELWAHWYDARWQTVSTLEDNEIYFFVHNSSYAICYEGEGSALSRYQLSSTNPIKPYTDQLWVTVADTSNSGYYYLYSYLGATDSNIEAYIYSGTSYSTGATASTTNQHSYKLTGNKLMFNSSYGLYYSSSKYILSSSSQTTFTAYKWVFTDLDAGSKGQTASTRSIDQIAVMEKAAKAPEKSAADVANTRAAVTNTLFRAGFENGSFALSTSSANAAITNTGWTAYNAGSGNNWTCNNSSSNANTDSYCASYQYNRNNQANTYLVSAPFIVSEDATALSLSLYEKVYRSTSAETFEAYFIKASDAATCGDIPGASKYIALTSANYTNTAYAQKTGSVSNVSALAGERVRLVIHCTSAADHWYLYIDDITVTETVNVAEPEDTVVYEEVSEPVAGETYIIALTVSGSGVYAVVNSTYKDNRYLNAQAVTDNGDGTITVPTRVLNSLLWQAGGSSSGWTFYNQAAGMYMGLNADDSYWLTLVDSAWPWLYTGTDLDNQCTESSNQNSSGNAFRYLSYSATNDDFTTSTGTGQNVKFYKPANTTPKYDITWVYYDANGVQQTQTDSVFEDVIPTPPTAPTRPDTYTAAGVTYAFTGWDKNVVAATENTTYTAQYSVQSYQITWNYKSAEGNDQTTVTDVAPGATPTFTAPDYTVDGLLHRFTGWTPNVVPAAGPMTYTANYSTTTYQITWRYKAGENVDPEVEYTTSTTETVPEGVVPTNNNHPVWTDTNGNDWMFVRWENANGDAPYAADKDETYTAIYEKVGVYTYTMYLYAVYGKANTAAGTHIYWYVNHGEEHNGAGIRQENEPIDINVPIYIPTPDTFVPETGAKAGNALEWEDHVFLGWARLDNNTGADETAHPELTEDNLYLKYNSSTGKFLVKDDGNNITTWTEVEKVAADEMRPYHDMYAVWADVFYVYHSGTNEVERIVKTRKGTYDLSAKTASGYLYGGYYTDYAGTSATYKEYDNGASDMSWNDEVNVAWSGKDTAITTLVQDASWEQKQTDTGATSYNGGNVTWTEANANKTVAGNAITPVAGTTYYIKEVPDNYLAPYLHYTYKLGELSILNAWLISAVDDKCYDETGFIIVNDKHPAKIATQLTVTPANGTAVTLKAHELFHTPDGASANRMTYLEVINKKNDVSLLGNNDATYRYWKTPDGLYVFGEMMTKYTGIEKQDTITCTSVGIKRVITADLSTVDWNNLTAGN